MNMYYKLYLTIILSLILSCVQKQRNDQQIIYWTNAGHYDTITISSSDTIFSKKFIIEFERNAECIAKGNDSLAEIIRILYPKVIDNFDYSWNYYLDNIRFHEDSINLLLKPISKLQNFQLNSNISRNPFKPVYCIDMMSYEFIFDKNYNFCKMIFHGGKR